ncbi:MAG: YceI family protein [Sphingomonadaceae bacterium]
MKLSSYLLTLPAIILVAACSPRQSDDAAPLTGDWTLDPVSSHLSFVSVKAGSIAEANTFKSLSGSITSDGKAQLGIDLSSVDSGVEIRNERLQTMLFETATYPSATVTAQLDPEAYKALQPGQSMTVTVPAKLNLHGVEGDVEGELAVTRAGTDEVIVSTIKPIILDANAYGFADGIEKLREAASLPAITPSVPVSFSVTFTR